MPRGAVIATSVLKSAGIASAAGALETSRTARGWVSAIDTRTRTIMLKGKNDEVSFVLETGGVVMERSNPAFFADLTPGEHVLIRYAGSETERVASEVYILARG